ncbi:hypothetical protein CPU12_10835 [Malaciobacter molluscorum LMG 25693]|uniref:beta-lactamase n=1 Tax=Malaciobacter molluscorum LMG 25693 TaxID=870501 RepID=A0A2G1DFY4_9BACT|nr:tetratricopeptide repeat protein [Malaciobacter molluscorum]AXX91699.1 tetratricopeptide repeat protein [Malaciobacter molluscorum LMG 25693]PHO17412.1 hypothetical protein CPU12_10835 [Malaciobacter molluscorum LMG 25693]
MNSVKIKKVLKLLFVINIIFIFTGCNDSSEKIVNNKIALQIPKVNENEIGKYYNFSDYLDAKTDPSAATKIGYSYSEELKDYDKAIKWYKYSNSMKPTGVNSNYMCYAYQMKKDYDEAIKWCKNAIDLGNKEVYANLGDMYFNMKKYEDSIIIYKEGYKKTNNTDLLTNIAYIYDEEKKDYKETEKWYIKASKEGNLKAYQGLSYLYFSKLNKKIKSSAYAIALIENKYSKSSVIKILKERNFTKDVIQKGYDLQLNSDEFPIKYKGKLDLDE